jgi:hypothetical protein
LLTGTIAPGGTHVVVAPNFATDIDAYADQLTNIWFDGSDAIVLVHGNTPIDIIGKVGESFDDGDYWFSNGVGTFYTVLVRKPTVDHGDADGTDAFLPDVEWIAYDADDYSHLGSHDAPALASVRRRSPLPRPNLSFVRVMMCSSRVTRLPQERHLPIHGP